MSNEKETANRGRRTFLKRAGAVVGAAGAMSAAGAATTVAPATGDKPVGRGYRETEHIRTYYDLARF